MVRPRFLGNVPTLVALAAVYFAAGKLGLKLAFVNASASAVWPCTGIALAAFLLLGYRVWPAILAGAFLVNLTTAGSVVTSLAIAVGNTLEGLIGCYLVTRFAAGKQAFQRAQDIFKFATFAAVLSPVVGATAGVTSLALAGFASWTNYGSIWSTWWLGDAVGAVVVTPLVLLWWENPRVHWSRRQIAELVLLFLGLFFTGWIVFGGHFEFSVKNYPLEYVCIPFLVWAAFRFGRRKAITATCALAAIATWGTAHGFGPFARDSQNTSLLLLQSFIGVMAVTSMALAAEFTEHKRADEYVRQLAVTDPLTGLANYRRLLDTLKSNATNAPGGLLPSCWPIWTGSRKSMTPTDISWVRKPSAAWQTSCAFIAAPLTSPGVTAETNSCWFSPRRIPRPLSVLPTELPSA